MPPSRPWGRCSCWLSAPPPDARRRRRVATHDSPRRDARLTTSERTTHHVGTYDSPRRNVRLTGVERTTHRGGSAAPDVLQEAVGGAEARQPGRRVGVACARPVAEDRREGAADVGGHGG